MSETIGGMAVFAFPPITTCETMFLLRSAPGSSQTKAPDGAFSFSPSPDVFGHEGCALRARPLSSSPFGRSRHLGLRPRSLAGRIEVAAPTPKQASTVTPQSFTMIFSTTTPKFSSARWRRMLRWKRSIVRRRRAPEETARESSSPSVSSSAILRR
jgi:hypothetical protein